MVALLEAMHPWGQHCMFMENEFHMWVMMLVVQLLPGGVEANLQPGCLQTQQPLGATFSCS